MSYLGNSPGVASQRVVTTITATSGQTTFTPTSGYTLGYCDVYFNGVKLVNGDDYTASDGATVVLASAAALNDVVEIVAHFPRGLSDGYLKAEADAKYVAKNGSTMTGDLVLDNGNADGAQLQLASSGSSNWNLDNYSGRLRAYYGSTEYFTINASGFVGVGTNAPAALLHAKGANTLTGNTRYLKTWVGGAGNWGSESFEELGIGYSGIRSVYTGADNWALAFSAGTSATFSAGTQAEVGRFDANGSLLLGTKTPAYSAKVVREDNVNAAVQSILVRNNNSGSSAGCGYFLNSYGNSWAIEMGSTAKNANALSISVDPLGSPVEKLRVSTGGVFTKYDSTTWTYIRDHGTYSVANTYLHIKLNLTKSSEKMLGFRLYGYKAYDTFIDTYFGTYLYNAYSTPYGSIVKDAGHASGGAIYYGADGYLVISCATNSNNYTGLRLETMVHGGDYGGGVDVQVLAYKGYATNTGAY